MRTRQQPTPPAAAGSARTPLHGIGGRNPVVLLAGGGAAVVLVVAMVRRGSSSSSGSTTQTPNTYDSTLSDIEAQWENQFEALQNQIAGNTQNPGGGVILPGPPRIQGGNPPRNVAVPPLPATLAAPPIVNALTRNQPPAAGATSAGMQRTYTASLSPAAKR